MTPRPTLFWTVKKEAYGSSFEVMRVTRVAPRQVYGSVAGLPTHCAPGDIHGEFKSEPAATVAANRIKAAYHSFDDRLKSLERETMAVLRLRTEAVTRAIKEVTTPCA